MSWDVILFNSSEKINAVENLDESKLIPANFCAVLESAFKNIKHDKNHREIKGDDFAINYFFSDELASNMLFNLYGEAALRELIKLSVKNDWQIFDTSLGEMIDLNNPSENGFKNFQSYLKQIINNKDYLTMLLKNTFVHHVHFWLKDKADKQKLIDGLETLIPIEHIRDIHIGVPADTFRDVVDRSYDVSLLILFDSPAAQEAYQVDPTHVLFADNVAKVLCSRVVVQDNVNV